MNNKKIKVQKGFNLAELLVVISVLGVVSSIMIPAAFNNYKQTQHRVQLEKAMENYDSALRILQIDSSARNMKTLNKNIGKDCSNLKRYFRVLKDEGCTFMTTDNVWYQFQEEGKKPDLNDVIVAFEKTDFKNADDESNNGAFIFVADIEKGKLHINNPGYKNASHLYKIYVNKTFNFINKNKNANN